MFERENNTKNIAIALLAGGLVGAGIALLMAPYSGRKMRGKIVDIAEDARDYAADSVKKLKSRIL